VIGSGRRLSLSQAQASGFSGTKSSQKRKGRLEVITDQAKGSGVSCRNCRHYQVTWDPNLPFGCAAHGFKSRKNPALVVYESSGFECQLFAARKSKPPHRSENS
jgi:hypothetical protein